MKKILLFLFMCLLSFLIYDNCSALEASEVNESNILEYFQENYSEYFNDYYFVFNSNSCYVLMSFDKPIYFSYTPVNGEFRIQPSHLETFIVSQVWLNKSDLSENKKNLNFNHPSKTNNSIYYLGLGNTNDLETTRNLFLYLNFDIYPRYSNTIYDDIILVEKIQETEPEPSPSPDIPPDTPALPGDEGVVSADDVIKVYMKYFLMGLPVALIMVSIEKFTEIFHNFVLGKMRK